MYEGKLYTSNGINSRQGVAIMVNNLYTEDKNILIYPFYFSFKLCLLLFTFTFGITFMLDLQMIR
jgi:hypothetical protein